MANFIANHLPTYSVVLVCAGVLLHRYFLAWEPKTISELDAWSAKLRGKILARMGK